VRSIQVVGWRALVGIVTIVTACFVILQNKRNRKAEKQQVVRCKNPSVSLFSLSSFTNSSK
jgi:hypothetical protein